MNHQYEQYITNQYIYHTFLVNPTFLRVNPTFLSYQFFMNSILPTSISVYLPYTIVTYLFIVNPTFLGEAPLLLPGPCDSSCSWPRSSTRGNGPRRRRAWRGSWRRPGGWWPTLVAPLNARNIWLVVSKITWKYGDIIGIIWDNDLVGGFKHEFYMFKQGFDGVFDLICAMVKRWIILYSWLVVWNIFYFPLYMG